MFALQVIAFVKFDFIQSPFENTVTYHNNMLEQGKINRFALKIHTLKSNVNNI